MTSQPSREPAKTVADGGELVLTPQSGKSAGKFWPATPAMKMPTTARIMLTTVRIVTSVILERNRC